MRRNLLRWGLVGASAGTPSGAGERRTGCGGFGECETADDSDMSITFLALRGRAAEFVGTCEVTES
jgi:hypothetical protein